MSACAKRDKEKKASVSAVRIVASQSNAPLPRTVRTICARKIRKITVSGRMKNRICRAVRMSSSIIFVVCFCATSSESVGKAAIANDIPMIPTGKY